MYWDICVIKCASYSIQKYDKAYYFQYMKESLHPECKHYWGIKQLPDSLKVKDRV